MYRGGGPSHQLRCVGIALMGFLLFLVACHVFGVVNLALFVLLVTFVHGIVVFDGHDLERLLSIENLSTIYGYLPI